MESDRPLKAYTVEEVWRNISSLTVWAESAEDAKRRVRQDDADNIETNELIAHSKPKGFAGVRRCPEMDRQSGASDAR